MVQSFFQRKFEISYASIAFGFAFTIIFIGLLSFIAEKVFWGYFMGGNAFSAMFLNPPQPEPYRWPISATYGLLAGYRPAPWLEYVLVYFGAIVGALTIAISIALVLTMLHLVIQRVFYANAKYQKYLPYLRKTFFWNTVLSTSTLFISIGGASMENVLIVFTVYVVVLFKQNSINKSSPTLTY